METEKRLILCFALSMLIIFAFSWINAKKVGEQTPEQDMATPTALAGSPPKTPVQEPSIDSPKSEISAAVPASEVQTQEAELSSWNWLPTTKPQEEAGEVVVESPLYRVRLSTHGAIPTSWQLLGFRELLEDRRYLELQATRGAEYQQQLAQLELDLLRQHEGNGEHYVEAIDTLFPAGTAGFQIRWGKTHSDVNIPYTCAQNKVVVSGQTDVRFVYESKGFTITKTFRFFPDSYHLEMEIGIKNNSGKDLTFDQNEFYDVLWQGGFGFPSMRKDTINNVLIQKEGSTGITPITSVIKSINSKVGSLLPEYKSSQTELLYGENVGWVGVGQKYFLAAIVPKTPTRQGLQGIATPPQVRSDLKPNVGVRMEIQTLGNGEERKDLFKLYVGPINEDDLAKAGEGLEDARQIFLRRIIGPIAHIMLRLLQGMYKIIPNYGFAIIVLTLLMKILMFPIYQKQIRTTKKMQALQPQINALKEKYKNDQQKLQKEQMELFRKHKVNPLSGCLTMLTTIPVFIALYATFAMAVELRGAPFFGWIQDLSAPDGAFFIPLGTYVIPVNILPIAYAILMLWSTSQQSMEGPNATAMKILPLIFVFIFWSIASGVILYFVVSIFIDVSQRVIMDKFKGDGLSPVPSAKSS